MAHRASKISGLSELTNLTDLHIIAEEIISGESVGG